jgi:DNA polymerase-1
MNERCLMGPLLLIDGHAYAYRAFHAIRVLTSPSGRSTNAIFGFIKTLEKLRGRLQPTHLAVVWDGGLAEDRMRALPEYKAQRPAMPESLAEQLDGIVAYLETSGVATLMEDGVEADDWIAGLALDAAAELPVVIASSDKDFMQLVSPRIGLVNPNDKVERVWGRDEVFAKCGVQPEQIVDWLSLVGDSVDNIPGVLGVGPKTAAELLVQFGTIGDLYARLAEVHSDRVRESLRAAEADVRRNQQLIRLRADAGRRVPLVELRPGEPHAGRLRELYERWGFRTLAASLTEPLQAQLL